MQVFLLQYLLHSEYFTKKQEINKLKKMNQKKGKARDNHYSDNCTNTRTYIHA